MRKISTDLSIRSESDSREERLIHKDIAIIRRAAYGSVIEERLFNTLILIAKANLLDNPDAETFHAAYRILKSFIAIDHNNYDFIRKLLVKLQQNAIEYDILDEARKKVFGRVPLLGPIHFREDGELTFEFNKPILKALKDPESMTLINFDILLKLSKRYSIPLYENFKASINDGFLELTLAQIRTILNMSANQYEKIAEFKRSVLNPSINEINEQTDIDVTYLDIKAPGKGGKVSGFKFSFTEKPQQFNIPSVDVLQKIALLYTKLPKSLKDSPSVIGVLTKYMVQFGEEYVKSNIDYFLDRLSDKMIIKTGPVNNPLGLFNTTMEKDYGKDARIKVQIDRILHKQEETDIEKKQMEKLLKSVNPSPTEQEDALYESQLQAYQDYFMNLSTDEKEVIRHGINEIKKTQPDNFDYVAPPRHVMMTYLKEVKGIHFEKTVT